ncbi:hypothetical protein [Sediminicurvatus halobius]|uniref:Uncharacterized protein n=1 Tax=Sediminicurvatus halobius TaxID=2182432 RepID=A0A2U2MXQ5_9GAMM|nr:hypothetical protein [Spiribacter halobius]PWG61597.1 hypothetical protein DEM34_15520 [Spiribacter halobius]UEX77275.1 hypothetical protein LMH63_15190 [Spiribacter halobius]
MSAQPPEAPGHDGDRLAGDEPATGSAPASRRRWLTVTITLVLFLGLMVLATVTQDARFSVTAITQWMGVSLAKEPERQDWPIRGLNACQPREDGGCDTLEALESLARPVLRLTAGTRVVFASQGADTLRISVLATPERRATLLNGLDGSKHGSFDDTLLLTARRAQESPHNFSFAFYGIADIGRTAGQTAGMLLSGEVRLVGRPVYGPRYTVYTERLEPGDSVLLLNAAGEPAPAFGAVYLNADRDQDGFSVLLQGEAESAHISRFGGTDIDFAVGRLYYMIANPITLYLGAVGVVLVVLGTLVQGLLWILAGPANAQARGTPAGNGWRARETFALIGRPLGKALGRVRQRVSGLISQHRCLFAALALGGALALPAPGTHAAPRQAQLTVFEQGQAVLVRAQGACLALAPLHVLAGDTGGYLIPEDGAGARYAGHLLHELPFDIAVLEVPEIPAAECGLHLGEIARGVSRAPDLRGRVQLRAVTGGGAIRTRPVRPEALGGPMLLVSPDGDYHITTGMSGSVITVDGSPLAMLLRVNEGGIGEALRLDYLAYWITPVLQAGAAAGRSAPAVAGDPAALAARILRVTARPAPGSPDADVLLGAAEPRGPWRAVDPPYPVEVELGLEADDGVPEIGCVRLDLRQVEQPARKPRAYELLVSPTAEGRNHRTLAHGTIPRMTRVWAVHRNVPVRAHRLLLRLRSNWGDPRQLALGRLLAYPAVAPGQCESEFAEP